MNNILADVSVYIEKGSFTISLSPPSISPKNSFGNLPDSLGTSSGVHSCIQPGESLPFLEVNFFGLDTVVLALGDTAHMKVNVSLDDLNIIDTNKDLKANNNNFIST